MLRRSGKPVILAANKVDNQQMELEAAALWSLGLGEPHAGLGAARPRSSGDLLDVDPRRAARDAAQRFGAERGPRRVALVGKPNVGKSSLLNKLAGEERVLVDPMAGTTRDPVDELIELGGKTWRFVDTAGIRGVTASCRAPTSTPSMRTRAALERSEVAVVLIDASESLTEQDLRIISLVIESGRVHGRGVQQVGPRSTRTAATTWRRRSTASSSAFRGRCAPTSPPRRAGTWTGWSRRSRGP